MSRKANVLLLITGFSAFLIGAATFRTAAHASWIMLFGVGLIIVGIISDARRARRDAENRRTRIELRVRELTAAPWPADQTFKVRGRSWSAMLIALLALTGSAFIIFLGFKLEPIKWLPILGSLPVLLMSVVAVSRALASLGKPAIELSSAGFNTPIFGKIPWDQVSGINLQQYQFRGQPIYTLIFRMNNDPRTQANFHWSERLIALTGLGAIRRGVITLPLRDRREPPEVTSAVAKFLWQQATGHSHEWNPLFSKAFSEASTRVAALAARRTNTAAEARERLPSIDELAQLGKDLTTMREEHARHVSRLNWIIGISVAGILLSATWPLLKRFWQA